MQIQIRHHWSQRIQKPCIVVWKVQCPFIGEIFINPIGKENAMQKNHRNPPKFKVFCILLLSNCDRVYWVGGGQVSNDLYTRLSACIHCLCIHCNVYSVAMYTMRGKLDQLLVRGGKYTQLQQVALVHAFNCNTPKMYEHTKIKSTICGKVKFHRIDVIAYTVHSYNKLVNNYI